MIDNEKLKDILAGYKEYFPSHWADERYKWEAIKHFQQHWNIESGNFAEMFEKATEKAKNLLASQNFYPRGMMIDYANADDAGVRQMFDDLFDEDEYLAVRIDMFKKRSKDIHVRYNSGQWGNNTYQNTNAISTYLWLRYPDRYYIYKYSIHKDVADALDAKTQPKPDGSAQSLLIGYSIYDEINRYLCQDTELSDILDSVIDDACYQDTALRTLTIDVGYYISNFYLKELQAKQDDADWLPADYSPGLTADDWVILLHDQSVFTQNALQVVKRMKDYGGQATCRQLSVKYGESYNFYNTNSSALAKRVADKTDCPVDMRESGEPRYWAVMYLGKNAARSDDGVFTWRLRPELSEALDRVDLSHIPLYVDPTPSIWKISHGTETTGISNANKLIFEERNVIVVHSTTRSKGISKVSQGETFMDGIKKGDFFYLCYGSSIRLLGRIIDDKPTLNHELEDGWYERRYEVVKESNDTRPYSGEKKWWTPNDNSTCIRVDAKETQLFEVLILSPYFNMTISELLGDTSQHKGHWWLVANPGVLSFSSIEIGEEVAYTLYNENGRKRRIYENFIDAHEGDPVVCYEADPVKKIVALGKISQGSDGRCIFFEKTEGLTSPIEYSSLKELPELAQMEFFKQPNGTLFKLSDGEYEFVMDLVREANPSGHSVDSAAKYSDNDFLDAVFMSQDDLHTLKHLLRDKKNLILKGAPGVGKTFAAKRLAYAMMGEQDDRRIAFVQFHQNYSYEDFIMGYRPDEDGFKLTDGVFYKFCQIAANSPDKEHFFIIDEINRGNMSKIFGEMLLLIERDYRGTKAIMPYSGTPFSVPDDLYIIGMMNTADRSLAMIDYALRRRFCFFDMGPGFSSDGFRRYMDSLDNESFNALIDKIMTLNNEIAQDGSLGAGFRIGHSYFCGRNASTCTDEWLRSVVRYEIVPTLEEYWFDEPAKVNKWKDELFGVLDD